MNESAPSSSALPESTYPQATRLEIIDGTGRVFVARYDQPGIYTQLQDDGRTLKIFVSALAPRSTWETS